MTVSTLLLSAARVASGADHLFFVAGPNGAGNQLGDTWANAMPSIDAAIAAAEAAGGSSAILVKEHGTSGGVYVPSVRLNPSSSDDRLKSFFVEAQEDPDNFMDIRGGYPASVASPDADDRNAPQYPTRLRGDLGSGLYSYHVVTTGLADERTRVDGFDIALGFGGEGAFPPYIPDANGIGGGIFCESPPIDEIEGTIIWRPLIANCDIHDNETVLGGGIGARGFQGGGGQESRRLVTMTVQLCRIHDNQAFDGGGIGCVSSTADVSNSVLHDNIAVETGGGIAILGVGDGIVRGCTVAFNEVTLGTTTDQRGGGIRVGGNAEGSRAQIWNSIFYFNDAPEGGVLSEIAGSGVAGNPSGTSGIHIFDSCVETFPVPNPVVGQNIMNEDPLFANGSAGNYHLTDRSPCIDAGSVGVADEPWEFLVKMPPDLWDVDEDLDFDELLPAFDRTFRVSGCAMDIGAHERSPCIADANQDGAVGAADLASLLGDWGPVWKNKRTDLTGDSVVGSADLAVMLGDWGCSYACEIPVQSMSTSGTTLDVVAAAAAFGFTDVVAFGEWLGAFGPETAGAVLFSFSSGGSDS
ncbi:MAG: hypothetical protein JNL80_06845 [Phycisphaerae bacterium]|nr:hypothetical protein [Phycisphaerae bacterium]